jgi:hypothetical protein
MDDFLEIITVFIACIFFFVKLGVPSAIILFKYNFIKVILVTCSGGITGIVLFTFLSASFLKWRHNYKLKRNKNHKKVIFTKSTRRIIKIKNRFGLVGIAFITPIISTPIGSFIAEKFYKDKKIVILYLSVSVIFWSIALYFLFYIFNDALSGWLI